MGKGRRLFGTMYIWQVWSQIPDSDIFIVLQEPATCSPLTKKKWSARSHWPLGNPQTSRWPFPVCTTCLQALIAQKTPATTRPGVWLESFSSATRGKRERKHCCDEHQFLLMSPLFQVYTVRIFKFGHIRGVWQAFFLKSSSISVSTASM